MGVYILRLRGIFQGVDGLGVWFDFVDSNLSVRFFVVGFCGNLCHPTKIMRDIVSTTVTSDSIVFEVGIL